MKRGQIIAPTGSGKTVIEHDAVNNSISAGNKIHLVLAPRIALVHQLLNEFWTHKKQPWRAMCICSSVAEVLELYEGESLDKAIETTTRIAIIENVLKQTQISSEPIVIFGTFHSTGRIAEALKNLGLKADLAVMDEAHNLTQESWSEWLTGLPCKAQLYFTATRKISTKADGSGRGMDNRTLFGDVLYTITPDELIRSGRIVAPRMHTMYPASLDEVQCLSEKEDLHLKIQMVVGGALKHAEVMNGAPARIIVFCESAEEAHDISESKAVQESLLGWKLGAVTSKGDRMLDKRKNIFRAYSEAHNSILFHYDVISEGVDLPGTTAILPLRELGEIKIVQAIGRALRVIESDRQALARGDIKVGDERGWTKPYGWVLLPMMGQELEWANGRIADFVLALREGNFNYDVERMTVVEVATPRTDPDNAAEFDEPKLTLVQDLFEGLEHQLKDIDGKVRHELEQQTKVSKTPAPVFREIKQSGILARHRKST